MDNKNEVLEAQKLIKSLRGEEQKPKKSHKRDRDDRQKLFAGQSGNDGNDELRTRRIELRFSPKELAKVNQYFEKSSFNTFGSFCREKLLAKPGTIKNNNEAANNLISISFQLQKIGTNINQIAKVLNARKNENLDVSLQENLIKSLQEELTLFQDMKKRMSKILSEGSL